MLGIYLLLISTAADDVLCQEKPTVTLNPLVHDKAPQAEQLASTVEDILTTTLTLMKSYNFSSIPNEKLHELDGMEDVAKEFSIDNVIGGRIEEEGDDIRVTLSVYNSAEDTQTVSVEGSASSYLAIFGLTDSLVLRLLSGFTEEPVSFGSVAFIPRGVERDYRVSVDGNAMGKNLRRIERIVADTYEVTIEDASSSRTLFDQRVEVPGNESVEVSFRIPYLYPDERKRVERTDAAIKTTWPVGWKSQELQTHYNEVFSFLEEAESRELTRLEERFEGLRSAQREAVDEYREQRVEQDGIVPTLGAGENITVDGYIKDWNTIPEYIAGTPNVPKGKNPLPPEETAGADIAFLKLALDKVEGNLYYLINLKNGVANEAIRYHVSFHPDTMEYYEFVAQHDTDGWELHTQRWHRTEGARPFSIDTGLRVRNYSIEGRIDIRDSMLDTSLEELISEDTFYVNAKAQRQQPIHDYEITRQKRVVFYRKGEDTLGDSITRQGDNHNVSSVHVEQRGLLPAGLIEELRPRGISRTVFVPENTIEIDGDTKDWSDVAPATRAEEGQNDNSGENYVPDTIFLARDDEQLYVLADFRGESVPVKSELKTELITFADPAGDGWSYMLEQRIENGGNLNIHVRKIRGRENVGETWFENVGDYEYNEEENLVEMAFPLERILPYMQEKRRYEAVFRLSNYRENWFKETRKFNMVLY
jgi:hypothetical protein